MIDNTRAPERIDLPGGWSLRYHETLGENGYHFHDEIGRRIIRYCQFEKTAHRFAAAMSTPAPRVPSRKEIAGAILGPRLPVPVGGRYTLSKLRAVRWEGAGNYERQDALNAADAVIALFFAPAQAAQGAATEIEGIDPRIAYSAKLQKIIEAICHGLSLPKDSANLWHYQMAARYIASLPSRPEPAAPVVPDELRELSEKATAGPWSSEERDYSSSIVKAPEFGIVAETVGDNAQGMNYNPELIAASVNFVRALLARQFVPPAASDEREGER